MVPAWHRPITTPLPRLAGGGQTSQSTHLFSHGKEPQEPKEALLSRRKRWSENQEWKVGGGLKLYRYTITFILLTLG